MIKDFVRKWIPIGTRRKFHKVIQYFVFKYSIRKFKESIAKGNVDEGIIKGLVYGWGNQGYSADNLYLKEVVVSGLYNKNSVLECGSGLSTIVLGILADLRGFKVYSLEHNEYWGERVVNTLRNNNIKNVQVSICSMKKFAEFDWYDVDSTSLPKDISLVICDGPPSRTRGGRYGFLPVLYGNLVKECKILVDDYNRVGEMTMVERWKESWPISEIESSKGFAVLVVK